MAGSHVGSQPLTDCMQQHWLPAIPGFEVQQVHALAEALVTRGRT
jgi:hypothetical protein